MMPLEMACEPSENKCFTFVWRIENFSFLEAAETEDFVESPRFKARTLGESLWHLRLFPKSTHESDKHLMLAVIPSKRNSLSATVNCEWSCLDSEGLAHITEILKHQRIEEPDALLLPHGPSSKQVFVTQRATFLPQDTLTVRCRIWKSQEDMEEDELVFARTRVDVREDSFIWSIKDFSTFELNQTLKTPYEIDFYPLVQYPFTITFSLKGITLKDSCFNFKIIAKNLAQSLGVTFNISILDNHQKVLMNRDLKTFLNQWKTGRFWKFVTRRALLNQYLCDDVLTLLFKVSLNPQCSGIIESSHYGNMKKQNSTAPQSEALCFRCSSRNVHYFGINPLNNSMIALQEEFFAMYRDRTLSDFELRSADASFPVHKNVLSVRSPVFCAMFSGNMKEASTSSLDISDLDTHTLNRMLTFLYTSTVEDLSFDSAIKLYYAADKYQISTLIQECSHVLRSGISVSNVCGILELADRHQDQELISFAHKFIFKHFDDILLSDEWDEFLLRNPYFAGKTMKEIYKEKIKRKEREKCVAVL